MGLKDDLAIFKAFSDETRLRILALLNRGELCVCEVVAVLEMPQGKISRHLSVLKNANLVNDRRDGTWIYYRLPEPDTDLKKRLFGYLVDAAEHHPLLCTDRKRLEDLACAGQICVPYPSAVSPVSRN